MPERFKKKKLNLRRSYWAESVVLVVLRLAVKILVAAGYTALFYNLGVCTGIWTKILCWITSYWISNRFVSWVLYNGIFMLLFPEEHDSELADSVNYSNDLRELYLDLKQLIFYTKDE